MTLIKLLTMYNILATNIMLLKFTIYRATFFKLPTYHHLIKQNDKSFACKPLKCGTYTIWKKSREQDYFPLKRCISSVSLSFLYVTFTYKKTFNHVYKLKNYCNSSRPKQKRTRLYFVNTYSWVPKQVKPFFNAIVQLIHVQSSSIIVTSLKRKCSFH